MIPFKIAICQNKPGFNKKANIARALEMLTRAAYRGVDLLMLPEIFYYPYELDRLKQVAEEKGETLTILREWAAKYKKYLCTGSLAQKRGEKIFNTAYFINPQGEVILEYSKCHLFDVDLPALSVQESAIITKGWRVDVVSCSLAKIGMLICYDIRFPEMARQLMASGAEIILVPAAFNTITGPAHWHITFRARAVENQCFIAAASPARNNRTKYKAYGHSLVVDPWGRILTEAGVKEKTIIAKIEPHILKDTRSRLPLIKHRREDIYGKKNENL